MPDITAPAGEVQLVVIERATHLFAEPGKPKKVAVRIRDWFV